MPVNDYLPFATSPGATVLSQPNYAGLTARGTGFQQGIADEYSFNKAMRQASMAAAVLAQFTVDNTGQDLLDDGNVAAWEAKLSRAVANNTSNVLFGSGGFRIKLTTLQNLYVSTTGNDANTGSSPTTAFATPQAAWSLIINKYDLNGQSVIVNIADGTYSPGLIAAGAPLGLGSGNSITFTGNTNTPTNVIINSNNQHAIIAIAGATINIGGMSLSATGVIPPSNGLPATVCAIAGGAVNIVSPCNFRATSGAHLWATQGGLIANNTTSYTISGGASTHYLATGGGTIVIFGGTQAISNNPAFVSGFAFVSGGSSLYVSGNTFTGTATGLEYVANLNGIIDTNGAGPNYFPGSSAGQLSSGGQYV